MADRKQRRIPRLRKIGNAEDEATGDAYEIFEFRKLLNRRGRIRVGRECARDPEKLKSLLISKNADLPAHDEDATIVVSEAIDRSPATFYLYSAHVGWRPNRDAFVLQSEIIGMSSKRGLRLLPPLWLGESQPGMIEKQGDLEHWRKEVAARARHSTRLALTLSAAFAAPLLNIMKLQPFGFNLYGLTKVGKTTLLLASTSVFGIGRESQLRNWNSTSASFQEAARAYNDLVLPANEVGLVAGRKADAYHHIRQMIYVFAEGRDRSRHSTSKASSSVLNASWRGIFISTAEHSFNDYAAFSGHRRDEGEFARCIDVPAARPGNSTVFDRRPKQVTPTDFPSWARRELVRLREACERNHGVAIGPYIEYLISKGQALETDVSKRCRQFERAIDSMQLEGALQHAAKNFAVIYAGGALAIDAGLLPLSEQRLRKAIVRCFKDSVSDVAAHDDPTAKARSALRLRLQSADIVERDENSTFGPGDHDGYFEVHAEGLEYTVSGKVFRSWFANAAQERGLVSWLAEHGYLKLGRRREKAAVPDMTRGTEWAQQGTRWPDGRNHRSFVFRDPFGGEALPATATSRRASLQLRKGSD